MRAIKLSGGETVRILDNDAVPNPICMDCGVNVDAANEDILLVEDVWLAAVPTEKGKLCIGCIESRLGRTLRREDFARLSLFALDAGYPLSDRVKDRLSW